MSVLIRKIWRDLLEARGQFISLIIIVSLGVAFYTGINATFLNLNNASQSYFEKYSFADYWIRMGRVPKAKLKAMKTYPEVVHVQGRVTADLSAFLKGETVTARLISLPDMPSEETLNQIWITSGRYVEAGEAECLLEETFYTANGFKIGDTLKVYSQGKGINLRVIGTARSPEYVYALKDGSELMADPIHFGVVYVSERFVQAALGYEQSYNEVILKTAPGTNYKLLEAKIDRDFDSYGVINQYDRSKQLSFAMLREEMRGLKSVSGGFPVVFMLVAAIIIYLMMGRMVEHQRTQIGVMKAFGYTDRRVLVHYLSYGLLVSILGSGIGALAGLYLGTMMTELENSYFHLPLKASQLYPELIAPAALMTMGFCLLASYQACKKAFKLSPSEAMRPKAPPSGKAILLEQFASFWNRLSFLWRMIFRNMFRHKRRNAMTSVGVMFGTAILVVTFGMMDTVNDLVVSQYETIQNYDLKITTSTLIPQRDWKTIEALDHVVQMEPLLELGVEMKNGRQNKLVALTAMVENAQLYRLSDKEGNVVSLSPTGLMMPDKLARQLNLKAGQSLSVRPLISGKKAKQAVLTRSVYQYVGMSAFCSFEQAEALLKEGRVANAFVLRIDRPENADKIKAALRDYKNVSSVMSKSDSLKNLEKQMELMTASLSVMIMLAGILSTAVIYNVATISIFERQRELASLKVLGLRPKEIEKIIFYENYLLAFIATLVGLPMGYLMGQLMMVAYETDNYSFQFLINPISYGYAVVMSFVFAWVSNLWLKKKIRRLDMISVLKSID